MNGVVEGFKRRAPDRAVLSDITSLVERPSGTVNLASKAQFVGVEEDHLPTAARETIQTEPFGKSVLGRCCSDAFVISGSFLVIRFVAIQPVLDRELRRELDKAGKAVGTAGAGAVWKGWNRWRNVRSGDALLCLNDATGSIDRAYVEA